MTVTAVLPRDRAAEVPATPVRRRSRADRLETLSVLVAGFALFLSVGLYLSSRGVIFTDALSRVANSSYVLFSRFPHLPAIGFVWNPLPSLAMLPILPFKAWWPQLSSLGLAAVVLSAACMATAAAIMTRTLRRFGVPRVGRVVLVVLFAAQPMVLLYAGNGLSESMFLMFLVLLIDQLVAWVAQARPGALIGAGLALAGAYLTRYEAVAAAVGVFVFVAAVSWWRSGRTRAALSPALNDVSLAIGPFLFAFATWATMARIIVGSWFPTFSSEYGNSAQVGNSRVYIRSQTGSTLGEVLGYLSRQLLGLAPAVAVLVVAAIVVAIRRRDAQVLAPLLVFGAVLGFDSATLVAGISFGWLRFEIMVIPLTLLSAGAVVGGLRPARHDTRRSRTIRLTALTLVALAVAAAIPVQLRTMQNRELAREEAAIVRTLLDPSSATAYEQLRLTQDDAEQSIAGTLDARRPGDGSVLADSYSAFGVITASRDEHQFVITSDPDFRDALRNPVTHHIRYLLVPDPSWDAPDALNRAYPTLYANGAGIATRVAEWQAVYLGNWRLYQVNGS